jgi:protein-S-isoprenylcysteine O-methyltransferase Ste14
VNRTIAGLGSAVLLFAAPGVVAGLIPWEMTHWRAGPAWLGLEPTRVLGLALIAAMLVLLLNCFTRFAWQGRGTPAPIAPTDRLVVSGPYRWVRNPMYVAVVGLVLGQALWLASFLLLVYATFLWGAFHGFVLAYEEPALRRRFPDDYADFFAAVPRWIPRLRPWKG